MHPDPDAPLAPGSRLGRYEVVAEIGEGGMASVYLARTVGDAGIAKLVALKCIRSQHAQDPKAIEMFLDEAQVAARIDHPNVCTVFDVGVEGSLYYIVLEYLHGEPLSGLLSRLVFRQELSPPPSYIARIVADACEGLHAAHELRGDDGQLLHVIHRDVSPHNIFVTYDGGTRIVDFGIVHASGRVHRTATGVLKGKVAYMSPEYVNNEVLDRGVDVWALGVTLWESLTRQRLFFREGDAATVLAILTEEIAPPSAHAPDIPEELDQIVLRALSRDRELRYPTTRAMGQDLNRFIAQSGHHVGIAEIAEMMSLHFSDRMEEKEKLLQLARRGPMRAQHGVQSPPVAGAHPSQHATQQQPVYPAQASPMPAAAASPVSHVAPISTGQVAPGQVAPGQVAPGQVAPGQVAPRQVPPGQVAPGQVAPGQVAPGQVAPGQVATGPLAPGQGASAPAPIAGAAPSSNPAPATDRAMVPVLMLVFVLLIGVGVVASGLAAYLWLFG